MESPEKKKQICTITDDMIVYNENSKESIDIY
jgi:hypothetical protein